MRVALYLILLILASACSKPKRTPYLTFYSNDYSISSVDLYHLENNFSLFQSAEKNTENNSWILRADSVPNGIYELRINQTQKIPLLLEGTMPVSIQSENKRLSINGNNLSSNLWEAQALVSDLSDTIKQLGLAFPDSLKTSNFNRYKDSIYSIIAQEKANAQKRVNQLIRSNKNTLLPLLLVQLKAGNHHLFDYTSDYKIYFMVDEFLQSYQNSYAPVQSFHNKVDSLRSWVYYTSVTLPGKTLPDISVNNAWGDPILLSRFRGRNTLYIVWNSQSEESRTITKNLMQWTRKYRYKGLDICLISTDTDKTTWQNAIKEDDLPVWHLCDLKGKNSPVLSGLGITKVPTLFVVDKNGVILERSSDKAVITQSLNRLIQK